jgi:hypothetical protein
LIILLLPGEVVTMIATPFKKFDLPGGVARRAIPASRNPLDLLRKAAYVTP